MIATSIWVNHERIGTNINLTIDKRSIYVNGGVIEKRSIYVNGGVIEKDFDICIFTHVKELKEIEYIDLTYVEINNIIIRGCKYIEVTDGYMNFVDKDLDIIVYSKLSEIRELVVKTTDGVMFIADEQ